MQQTEDLNDKVAGSVSVDGNPCHFFVSDRPFHPSGYAKIGLAHIVIR